MPRYNIVLPVEIGGVHGVTRSFGVSGVQFDAPIALEVGRRIDFAVSIAGDDRVEPLRLECGGEVIRVDAVDGGMQTVAATIDRIRIGSIDIEPGALVPGC